MRIVFLKDVLCLKRSHSQLLPVLLNLVSISTLYQSSEQPITLDYRLYQFSEKWILKDFCFALTGCYSITDTLANCSYSALCWGIQRTLWASINANGNCVSNFSHITQNIYYLSLPPVFFFLPLFLQRSRLAFERIFSFLLKWNLAPLNPRYWIRFRSHEERLCWHSARKVHSIHACVFVLGKNAEVVQSAFNVRRLAHFYKLELCELLKEELQQWSEFNMKSFSPM